MDRKEIDKLRALGLTEETAAGKEAVRVSLQLRRKLFDKTLDERRLVLQAWQQQIGASLMRRGAELVPDSLSITGQSIEAVVPVEQCTEIEADMDSGECRIDLIVPRQVVAAK